MKTILLTASFVAGIVVSSTVHAQAPAGAAAAGAVAGAVANGGVAVRQGGTSIPVIYNHASTLQEGALRGWADLYRGAGDYNYNTSLANVNNQEAYSRALDNSVKQTQAYFARKEINQQAQMQKNQRPSAEDIARFARERAPEPLAGYEYEPTLGDLDWPSVLRDKAFTPEREQLDELFAGRSITDSGLGSMNHRQIEKVTDRLMAKLKSRIRDYSPSEYMAARSFLGRIERTSLEHMSAATGLAFK